MTPAALTIAGSDSGGGAGIQADLKTFAMYGVFGLSAITAVTAQNTRGVTRVDPLPPAALQAQLEAVFADLPVGAVKIGMLATADHARVVARFLRDLRDRPPIVLDPVMVASTGHRLLTDDAVAVIRDELLPLCTLATPNLAEADVLAGGDVAGWLASFPGSVLVTGGDPPSGAPGEGGIIFDRWFADGALRREWTGERIGRRPFHGTGCTLSSAIAADFALASVRPEGAVPVEGAIDRAITWVRSLIRLSHDGASIGGGNPTLPHHLVRPV